MQTLFAAKLQSCSYCFLDTIPRFAVQQAADQQVSIVSVFKVGISACSLPTIYVSAVSGFKVGVSACSTLMVILYGREPTSPPYRPQPTATQ